MSNGNTSTALTNGAPTPPAHAGRFANWPWYVFVFLVPILAVLVHPAYRGNRLDVPFYTYGDTVYQTIPLQSWLDGEPWNNVQRLGAPDGTNFFAFPLGSYLDYAFAVLLTLLFRDAGIGLNLAWMLRLGVSGVVALWCWRRLGLKGSVAVSLAILFSLLTYNFRHGVSMYNISPVFVPVGMSFVLLVLGGRFRHLSTGNRRAYWVLLGLAATSDPHAVIFIGICLGATILLQLPTGWKNALIPLAAILVMGSVGIAVLLPGVAASRADRTSTSEVWGRGIENANRGPLLPANLLEPLVGVAFPDLRDYLFDYIEKHGRGEPASEGVVVAVGFLILLFLTARIAVQGGRAVRGRIIRSNLPSRVGVFAILALLVGCFGGFSNYLILVFPPLRSYYRIALIVAFASLLAVGWSLRWVLLKTRRRPRLRWLARALPALVCLIGVVSQMNDHTFSSQELRNKQIEEFDDAVSLCHRLRQTLPRDAMIFQDSLVGDTPPYLAWELGMFYYATRDFRWSFVPGYLQTDRTVRRYAELREMSPADQAQRLAAIGFVGILIDCGDMGRKQPAVDAYLATGDPRWSPRGRYVFIDWRRRSAVSPRQERAEVHSPGREP